jgi:hypothetical protein
MNRGEWDPIRVADMTTNGRVVPLPVAPRWAADVDHADDALDSLVATVDDLVRDLATDRVRAGAASADGVEAGRLAREWLATASGRLAPTGSSKHLTLRRAALVLGALLVVVAVEFVLVGLVVSHL